MEDKILMSKIDVILSNQETICKNQVIILNLLSVIYSKVFDQNDFKDLMIDIVGNGVSYRLFDGFNFSKTWNQNQK